MIASVGAPDGRLVVRAPNHLGDLVMAMGALEACGGDVMVHAALAPLARLGRIPGRILPYRRTAAGWFDAVDLLRRGRYRRGVLLSASFSAALLFRAGGVSHLRGTATDGRSHLLSDPVDPATFRGHHRVNHYRDLLGLPRLVPPVPPRFTLPSGILATWRERLSGGSPPSIDIPLVALFPGSNAPARRWPAERFRDIGRALAREGIRVVVLGGPAERALTAEVTGDVPGVIDLGGATDLIGLAAVLSLCDLLVTNDTGPMHLAGAVGARTVTLWGSSSPGEVHPVGGDDLRVRGSDLPCAPCRKNRCPRSGPGTILPDAYNECLATISPAAVLSAVRHLLP